MTSYRLAQLNVARMKYALDDGRMRDFVDALDPINAQADAAPGFVWRLADDDGDATSFRILDDDLLLVNLSVWESVEALKAFSYKTDHAAIFRRRAEWFEPPEDAHLVLWWVPEGHVPTVAEASERLHRLRRDGPGPAAFTFGTVQPQPT